MQICKGCWLPGVSSAINTSGKNEMGSLAMPGKCYLKSHNSHNALVHTDTCKCKVIFVLHHGIRYEDFPFLLMVNKHKKIETFGTIKQGFH